MTSGSPPESAGQSDVSEEHLQRQPRLRFEFRSEALAEPFREQFEEELTIVVDSIVQLPDDTHLQYWTVTGGSQTNIAETVVEFPTTLDARLLSTVGNTHRFEVHGSSRSLFSAFNEFDGETKSAVYDEQGVHIVADFRPDINIDEVEETVHDLFPDLELVSLQEIRTTSILRPLIEDQLTGRQQTALRLAYFGGYYEQPRMSTGEELADRMGISKQAFHEHLRKAYATIFRELLENGDRYSWVDS